MVGKCRRVGGISESGRGGERRGRTIVHKVGHSEDQAQSCDTNQDHGVFEEGHWVD